MVKKNIMRTDEEINDLLNRCMEAEGNAKSKYPSMTYEQGVLYTIRWLFDASESHPLDED